MHKNTKYPVKYAVLELKTHIGKLKGYIVSKCFVLESTIKYLDNDSVEVNHKVIFPYTDIDAFERNFLLGKKKAVSLQPNISYFITEVKQIYDEYEEAKECANKESTNVDNYINNNLRMTKSMNAKAYAKLKSEIKENVYICEEFEKYIISQTENMIVKKDKQKTLKLTDLDID